MKKSEQSISHGASTLMSIYGPGLGVLHPPESPHVWTGLPPDHPVRPAPLCIRASACAYNIREGTCHRLHACPEHQHSPTNVPPQHKGRHMPKTACMSRTQTFSNEYPPACQLFVPAGAWTSRTNGLESENAPYLRILQCPYSALTVPLQCPYSAH